MSGSLRLYSSTAVRARDTALAALSALQLPHNSLMQSEELLELEMGEWEGALRAECYTPAVLAAIAADPHTFSPPGGESQLQVEERMLAFLHDVVLPAGREDGRQSVVVGHGMAFKCTLRKILKSSPAMTRRIQLDNTGITELAYVFEGPDRGWHVLRVNDTRHLQPEQLQILKNQ